MDGTLMGNKHVVAISVNCVDGGSSSQIAQNLVPVGIFEIQKESNELLRKTLPKEFLELIQSIKQLGVTRTKYITVKIRLGGDFQNAVLEMNLADPNDRVVMGRYVRTGAFNEADIEEDESAKESLSSSLNLNGSNESSSDTTEDEEINSNQEKKEFDSVPTFMSRNIFQVKPRENRWKSFKRRHN
ncbi:unnamed protein product [Rotaria sordida]|uniref:Uncharacterized protein n=1 Tax=Rotaria sordida TaxID=392033 RepID=A0A815HH75_9BILA|nr:unnamed protein product [Rotaria sordida]CAF1608606.1 unnamed protein product [Rotaria sordida]